MKITKRTPLRPRGRNEEKRQSTKNAIREVYANGPQVEVQIIPAKKELEAANGETRKQRVCAYCRVSTDEDNQASSYELQVQKPSGSTSSGSSSRPVSGGRGDATTPPPAPAADQPTAPTPATPVSQRFGDVSANAWYCDAVQYVYDKGMIQGVSETSFAPTATTTRGAIVTMLHRLEGEPTMTPAAFADVSAGLWYADSVAWAAAKGIVNGYEDNSFRPDDPITREQVAAILYRYAAAKGLDVTAPADLSAFADAEQVSSYAVQALAWANAKGIITGKSGGVLDPKGQASRAEVAAMLMRYMEKYATAN